MIGVTRLNGTKVTINAEHIETVDETPDTVITLVSGKKFIVTEKTEDVTNLVIEYKKKTHMINAVG